jgi:MFS family permease
MRARLFAPENRKWWTLVAVAVGLFMIMLDNTVVIVALPSIQQDLGMSPSELEWVVNAYALTFGVLLLSGGKLADLLGRRAIFIAGLVIFTGASLWCGLAGGAASLIAARTVQGIGAALMNPPRSRSSSRPSRHGSGGRQSGSGQASRRSRLRSARSWAACSRRTSAGAGSSSSISRSEWRACSPPGSSSTRRGIPPASSGSIFPV